MDVVDDLRTLAHELGLEFEETDNGWDACSRDDGRHVSIVWDSPARDGFLFLLRTPARPDGYAIWLLMRTRAEQDRTANRPGDQGLAYDAQLDFVRTHWTGWLADERAFAAAYDRLNRVP